MEEGEEEKNEKKIVDTNPCGGGVFLWGLT
jgi:hypothetical protein